MPAEQPVFGECFLVLLRGVEHHLDHAFYVTVGGRQCRRFHSKAVRDRGPHLILVEDFALDLAGLEDVFCQGLKDGLFPQWKTECLHAADQPSLAVPDGRKLPGEPRLIPFEFGPISQFIDVFDHSPHLLRRI